jgi:hypothetical protein
MQQVILKRSQNLVLKASASQYHSILSDKRADDVSIPFKSSLNCIGQSESYKTL